LYLKNKKIVISDSNRIDIASSFQFYLEEICLILVKFWLSKTNQSHLCIAGGVGLNVKVNQKIWETLDLRDLYIQPAAGDAGLVLGACALINRKNGIFPIKSLRTMYLGPDYENNVCRELLKNSGLEFYEVGNIAEQAAIFINEGMVIGWFQGRMEFGPRALGNRSVLADPTKVEMQDYVNQKIKFREEFRPFCPSIALRSIEDIFVKPKNSPYMTIAFSTLQGVSKLIPAVIHKDNTSRPQTLAKTDNELYFQLLTELEKLNGYPVVLNTSMNVRGEPMCLSPTDAIDFFVNTNIDVLIIDNFICEKSRQNSDINKEITANRIKTKY
jgi:carbamoyltransferase